VTGAKSSMVNSKDVERNDLVIFIVGNLSLRVSLGRKESSSQLTGIVE